MTLSKQDILDLAHEAIGWDLSGISEVGSQKMHMRQVQILAQALIEAHKELEEWNPIVGSAEQRAAGYKAERDAALKALDEAIERAEYYREQAVRVSDQADSLADDRIQRNATIHALQAELTRLRAAAQEVSFAANNLRRNVLAMLPSANTETLDSALKALAAVLAQPLPVLPEIESANE